MLTMFGETRKYCVNSKIERLSHAYKQVFIGLLAGSASVTYGIQSGWISPAKKVLQSDSSPSGRPLTDGEITWVASILPLVATIGGFLHPHIADKYGRKVAIISTLFFQSVSWITLLISSHFEAILIARAFAGIGGTGCFILLPLYIKETCQDNVRGTLVTLCLSSQHIGVLSVYAMGSYLNYYTTLWICLSYSVISICLVIMVSPETPPFLVKRGKSEEAAKIVAVLRGLRTDNQVVQDEVNYIKYQEDCFKSTTNDTFKTILKNKAMRNGFFLCFVMLSCVSLNGCIVVVMYAHSIIEECGVSISPGLLTLSVPLLMILGTLVPLTCADKIGRKFPLLYLFLLSTLLLSAMGFAVLASSLLIKHYAVTLPSFVPVAGMATAVCAYSMGVLTMPHVIMSEMFPFKVRAKLIGFLMPILWLLITLQVTFCDLMSKVIGIYGVYFVCAAINFSCAVFVAIFIPETKRKTLEEIQDILAGNKADQPHQTNSKMHDVNG